MRNEQRDFYFLLHGSPLLRRSPANLGFLILFSLSKSKKKNICTDFSIINQKKKKKKKLLTASSLVGLKFI